MIVVRPRSSRQSPRHADALALAAGQGIGHARGHRGIEFHEAEQFGNPCLAHPLARQSRADGDVFSDIHMWEQADPLKHIADPAPQGADGQTRGVFAIDQHTSGIGDGQAIGGLEQRRFARARCADERDELAVGNGDRDLVHRAQIAVVAGDRVELEGTFASAHAGAEASEPVSLTASPLSASGAR